MQEYKSLRVWAMIRVNTQTHRQASVDRLYYYFSQLSEKKTEQCVSVQIV